MYACGLRIGEAASLSCISDDVRPGFIDRRAAHLIIEHRVATLVGQRVYGIALGYEDLNDHDERHDSIMAVLAGKLEALSKDCAPVAGKSTLNRLERSQDKTTRYHKLAMFRRRSRRCW